ncbi:MAG TPA: lanthionine synthetase C family protein [Mycobacteriales bacterium]
MSRIVCSLNVAARVAADRIAHMLASPAPAPPRRRWHAQSLADGAAGTALLHIERAHAQVGDWGVAHAWLANAAQSDIVATTGSGLYFGAPAVAFALHAACTDGSDRYTRALSTLDRSVIALTHRRIDQAHARIASGHLPKFTEFDVISGLAGIGAYLLHHRPGDDALERVLSYLVRLSEPLRSGGETLPGWWTDHGPDARTSPDYPGGHGNFGMAHGIAGPLTLLASARRRGITADGDLEAVERICAWLDTWRQDRETGPWWPQWITKDELHRGRVHQPGPLRPSWCYGTPGVARAQQLAAIAVRDAGRQQLAEQALAACLSDANQLGRITDSSLCHGWAGLFQTAWRAAVDAATPTIAANLPRLAALLVQQSEHGETSTGFLEGDAGLALALYTVADTVPTISGWDACLLIT